MTLDDSDWRAITFEGVTFPPTLMAISVLEPILEIQDEDLGDWLWRFPICRGCSKQTSAKRCFHCAGEAIDLMLEHREKVLGGIAERLSSHGMDPGTTYLDWITSLQQIRALSKDVDGDCTWSAPSHPRDRSTSKAAVLAALDRLQSNATDNPRKAP